MAVYVCFTFFNELDLLRIHLEELFDAVDYFVLVESTVTHQGEPKSLYYSDNKHLFTAYEKKIRHIVVDDMPATDNPWVREEFQRNCIKRGLDDALPDSTIIVTDVDEIVRPEVIDKLRQAKSFRLLIMDMYIYYLNWYASPWCKAYGAPWSYVKEMSNISVVRWQERSYLGKNNLAPTAVIESAGWHFSWMGGMDRILTKMNSFAHTETEVRRHSDAESLRKSVEKRQFFYDNMELFPVPIDETFPKTVQKNQDLYRKEGLISEPAESQQGMAGKKGLPYPAETVSTMARALKKRDEIIAGQRVEIEILNREKGAFEGGCKERDEMIIQLRLEKGAFEGGCADRDKIISRLNEEFIVQKRVIEGLQRTLAEAIGKQPRAGRGK